MADNPIHILLVSRQDAVQALFTEQASLVKGPGLALSVCPTLEGAVAAMCGPGIDLIFLQIEESDPALGRRILLAAQAAGCSPPVVALLERHSNKESERLLNIGATDFLTRTDLEAGLLGRVIRYSLANRDSAAAAFQAANFDPLTGVPNRLLFFDRLDQALQRAERDQHQLVLMVLDLNGFRRINDSYGHEAGDRLIERTARRLMQVVDKTDTLARIGGDEFAILVEEPGGTAAMISKARQIAAALSKPIVPIDQDTGERLSIACSIGIAVYPQDGRERDKLLRAADLARQEAKRPGGHAYRFYNQDFDQQINRALASQLYQEADLRRALRRGEFVLEYQPRVCLATGRIAGVEALIRWQHRTQGLVMPEQFIPLAEDMGLISSLGYWAVHRVCEDIKVLDERFSRSLDVAINLSFRQFQDSWFTETVAHIIRESGVDPGRLEFELTESAIMANAEETGRCMRDLSELGASFSLDDFGTGYSSFAHIRMLPISALKIDRRFVRELTTNTEDATIVKAIISLAHSLDMVVIAEGAESQAQLNFLRDHHCDQVQGFYLSRPVGLDSLCGLLVDLEQRYAGLIAQ